MSNDDHKAKADIEDVESEVGAAAEARTFVHAISKLVFLAPLDAKDAKDTLKATLSCMNTAIPGLKLNDA